MITGLEINNLSTEKIEMYNLTKNTIVLFNNSELKTKFVREFLKIKFDETDKDDNSVFYSTVIDNDKYEEQSHKAHIKIKVEYLPTSIYYIDNEQKFIFTTEAPFILQCNDLNDLWFCDENNNGDIQVYAFTDFKGHKETWKSGIYEVYKKVLNGQFGCYEGYGR